MNVNLQALDPPAEWGVHIDREAVEWVALGLADHRFPTPSFDYVGVPHLAEEEWARFVLVAVSVVWRLWPPEGEQMWAADLDGAWLDDASGIWACFTREPRSVDLAWIRNGSGGSGFFSGRGILQDVPRRINLMAAVAGALLDRWNGRALGIVEEAGGRAEAITELLVDTIPGYRDRPSTGGRVLPFDKLAHLAVAMLSSRIPITGVEDFGVYPDYMLPRHLRHRGILVYESALAAAIDTRHVIEKESRWELGIRWATVRAAALLKDALAAGGNPVTTPQLDFWLWSEAVLGPDASAMGEHHRTITEAY